MITIYSPPGPPPCQKCILTKHALDKAEIPYTEVELDDDTAVAFREAGHRAAPVVHDKLTGETWSDFRRDKIKEAIKAREVAA